MTLHLSISKSSNIWLTYRSIDLHAAGRHIRPRDWHNIIFCVCVSDVNDNGIAKQNINGLYNYYFCESVNVHRQLTNVQRDSLLSHYLPIPSHACQPWFLTSDLVNHGGYFTQWLFVCCNSTSTIHECALSEFCPGQRSQGSRTIPLRPIERVDSSANGERMLWKIAFLSLDYRSWFSK